MSVFLDVVVLLIVGLTMLFVIKKGFIKSLLDLLSVICSIILSKIFSPSVASFFYNSLSGSLKGKIENAISAMFENNTLPEVLEQNKLNILIDKYDLSFAGKGSTIVDQTASAFAETLTVFLSYCLAYIAVFFAVIIAFKIITPFICLVFKLPVLKTINKLLSYGLAFVLALVYLMVFVALMQMLVPFLTTVYPEIINETVISNTFIFDYLYNLDWLNIFVI